MRGNNIMAKLIHFFLFLLFQYNAFGNPDVVKDQSRILETYDHADVNSTIEIVKKDLLSEDALSQDAGCIILLKTLDRLKQSNKNAETVFAQLAGDKKVVLIAADIIDSRLLGWYNRDKSDDGEDDIKLYSPLFHILGRADEKTAKGTLVKALLYLQGRKDILEGIPMNEDLVALSLKKLKIISDRLCCLYPGRDYVVAMLEKDSRSTMLDIFAGVLGANGNLNEKTKKDIGNFVVECMEYGDSKNGYLIRMKAVKLAGMLVKAGEKDLSIKIGELARNDPYYVHKYDSKAGYSLTEIRFPVREISSKVLLN
jgi:hypothetical protein